MVDDYAGGLVSAPRWVGWCRRHDGWQVHCAGDSEREVRRQLSARWQGETLVLPAGQVPEEGES